MKKQTKIFCVISHTHWDREWYMPFEEFRVKLVELIDRLFIIIDENPEYVFHLDAQTIVLEDYLEIRPHKRPQLEKLIQSGNILIGPWYLQNDFYLTSGEATIRNLLLGRETAKSFGAYSKPGYAPDQFGNISQLPQILSQFDIESFIFGRGFGHYMKDEGGQAIRDKDGKPVRKKTPTEFIWEGPDGSKLLAIHMKYWYNNAQRIYADTDNAIKLLDTVENLFDDFAATPYLLMMNGVDHLEAQDDLLPILENINAKLTNGRKIIQTDLETYVDMVKAEVGEKGVELPVYRGELRQGHDWEILKGTLSSRVYLKQENVRAQDKLEQVLEPLSSMYEIAGAVDSYDKDYLDYLWKSLLKTHPHDSICGCSRDEVHDHMEDLYARIDEAASYLLEKKKEDLITHSEIYDWSDTGDVLGIINPHHTSWKGILKAELVFLAEENVQAFALETLDGEDIGFLVTAVNNRRHDVFTALNLPGILEVRAYDVLIKDPGTNPFSLKGLKVVRKAEFKEGVFATEKNFEKLDDEAVKLSTGDMEITVLKSGKIDLTSKLTGKNIENAIRISDEADIGDSYIFMPVEGDNRLYADDFPAKVEELHYEDFYSSVKITYNMVIPASYDRKLRARSVETIFCPVELTLTAAKETGYVEIEVHVDNKADNHRMRLLVDSSISSKTSFGDTPFDLITHPITKDFPDTFSNDRANTSLAGIEHPSEGGFAVFTCGNHEYEHLISKDSVLAFTLFRGNPYITVGQNSTPYAGAKWYAPANQCKRIIKSRFAILNYKGHMSSLPAKAAKFKSPPRVVFASCDPKKFAGGRFAIQGSDLPEFYYLPDPHPGVRLKDNQPQLEVDGSGIQVTALKKSEDRDSYILRLVNLHDEAGEVTVRFKGTIAKSRVDEAKMPDPAISKGERTLSIGGKEILTLLLDDRDW